MSTIHEPFVTHVLKKGVDWVVLAEGGTEPLSVHPTKEKAIRAAVSIARDNPPSKIKIHRPDGSFEEERAFDDELVTE